MRWYSAEGGGGTLSSTRWSGNDQLYAALRGKAYLSLCEVQVHGDLVAPQPGQVVMMGELGLELSELLLGERCSLLPRLAAGVHLKAGLLDICRQRCHTAFNPRGHVDRGGHEN